MLFIFCGAFNVAEAETTLAGRMHEPRQSPAGRPQSYRCVATSHLGDKTTECIALASELTGGYTSLLPMLGAYFAAMLVPTILHNSPIYESLGWDDKSS
jgi:hypothetical protein